MQCRYNRLFYLRPTIGFRGLSQKASKSNFFESTALRMRRGLPGAVGISRHIRATQASQQQVHIGLVDILVQVDPRVDAGGIVLRLVRAREACLQVAEVFQVDVPVVVEVT